MTYQRNLIAKLKIYHFYFLSLLHKKEKLSIKDVQAILSNSQTLSYMSYAQITLVLNHLCSLNLATSIWSEKTKITKRKVFLFSITEEGEQMLQYLKVFVDEINNTSP